MKAERWRQIDQVLQAALGCEGEQRQAFLDQACGGDKVLRREVESLLLAHEEAGSFMEDHVSQVAAELMAEEKVQAEVGRVIAHYRIIKELGRGGMGEVYLAEDMRLGRDVALKLLPSSFTRDANRVCRFRQEARAASSLNHPNIVTIYEIGQSDSLHYIATEYIDGVTLRRHMNSQPMKASEALEIAAQVASALAAAHAAGIVHRDIKPENVMVRPDGYVKILDFGLAKHTERPSNDSEALTLANTEPGLVMGTAHYMSPEQARGLEVDSRTDVWSLGVMLYEMVSDSTPFDGETPSDVLASLLKTEPPSLTQIAPDVPAELERIVAKALRKDREGRYQTVKDLLIDLKSLKQDWDFKAKLERSEPREVGRGVAVKKSGRQAPAEATGGTTAHTTVAGAAHPTSSTAYIVSGIKRHKGSVVFAATILSAAIAAFSYFYITPSENAAIDSIAVLPFVNTSPDQNTEWLSDGITESVIYSLSQLPNLRVVSRNSVFHYKGREADLQAVGRELDVQAVLTGRFTQRGDDISISTELTDARDNRLLWGEHYNHKLTDVVTMQEEIAKRITERLRVRLTGEEQKRLTRRYTENSEAYQLYLKGRYFWNKRTPEGHQKSIEYFDRAIEKDPNFALAFVGLADNNISLPFDSDIPPKEALPKAKAAAIKALEIDDTLAEAHASLAFVKFNYDWDFAGAEEEFKRAMTLNPNYATAHQWYARYLSAVGRHQEASAEANRARELDPLSLIINTTVGQALFWARRYDQAGEGLRRMLEIDPNFWVARLFLGKAYEQERMYPKAIVELQKAREFSGNNSEAVSMIGYVYAVSGRRSAAQQVLNELKKLSKQRYIPPYNIAMVYTGLGEKDQAFQWLEKAYEDRNQFLTLLKVEPKFDSLRSDPRFADLVRRVGISQ